MGVKSIYVLLYLGDNKETHKQNSRKSQENAGTVPGQSWDNPRIQSCENCVSVFPCLFFLVFSGHIFTVISKSITRTKKIYRNKIPRVVKCPARNALHNFIVQK